MAQAPIGPADRKRLDAALPKLCELLRDGNFLKTACGILRIDERRAHARILLASTDSAQPSDVQWALEVGEARQSAIAALVQDIRLAQLPNKNGGHDWKASAWLLERLDPKSFGDAAVKRAADAGPEQVERVQVNIFPPSSETAKAHALELAAKATP